MGWEPLADHPVRVPGQVFLPSPQLSWCFLFQGMEIVTGEAGHGNYFRLHFNRYNMVDSITCFSKEPFPVSNYICLYGQHERLLNDLCYRWRAGQLTDLYR